MIVENPYTQPHYLTYYFPISPSLIDMDRSKNGDYFNKPTQYWFLNCKPNENVVCEPLKFVKKHTVNSARTIEGKGSQQVKRSLIHPQYARRFIISHILDCPGGVWMGEGA